MKIHLNPVNERFYVLWGGVEYFPAALNSRAAALLLAQTIGHNVEAEVRNLAHEAGLLD